MKPDGRPAHSDPAAPIDGSQEAFRGLFDAHQTRVRACLARYVRDPNLVDDLVQNTFLRGFRNLHRFRGEASLGTWLVAIARREALLHLREDRLRRDREGSAIASALGRRARDPASADDASRETELAALEQCLDALHERSARLVREFYFEGRTARQIAEADGRSEVSVWVAILRIRRALRRCIEARTSASAAK